MEKVEYLKRLAAVHLLILQGLGDSEEADVLREEMEAFEDAPRSEIQEMNNISAWLYTFHKNRNTSG